MTAITVEKGLVSLQAVMKLIKAMQVEGIDQIHPNKVAPNSKFRNDAIDEMIIDDEGNVFLRTDDGEEICLPQLGIMAFDC